MKLIEFARLCQTDSRLTAAWTRLLAAAHDRISLEIDRVFREESAPDVREGQFLEAGAAMEAACAAQGIQSPDLSLKRFTELLLQYK